MADYKVIAGYLVFLLFIMAIGFPSCPYPNVNNTLVFPSVIHDSEDNPIGGQPVEVTLQFFDGHGDVYFENSADVGYDTAVSIRVARQLAFQAVNATVNIPKCDMRLTLKTPEDYRKLNISGPSGGAAFYVLIRSELENISLRNDAAITGTVLEDGRIDPVGGYYEKSKYLPDNIRIILVPELSLYDQLVQYPFIRPGSDVKVIEIKNLSDAYLFLTGQKDLKPKEKISAEIEAINTTGLENVSSRFQSIGVFAEMVGNLITSVESRISASNVSPELKTYFSTRLDNNRKLYALGYYYTAGNDLFLLDSEIFMAGVAASGSDSSESNLGPMTEVIERCLFEVRDSGLRNQNLETIDIYTGIAARSFWSLKNLESIKTNPARESQIDSSKDLGYAYGWCEYSRNIQRLLNSDSQTGSNLLVFNQSSLSERVFVLLYRYNALNSSSGSDIRKYYSYAQESYQKGDNLAALFNLYFAKASQEFLFNSSSSRINELVPVLLGKNYSSFWANVYATQMFYMANTDDNGTAVRLGILALNMDKMQEDLEIYSSFVPFELAQEKVPNIPVAKANGSVDLSVPFILASCFILLTLLTYAAYYFHMTRKQKEKKKIGLLKV